RSKVQRSDSLFGIGPQRPAGLWRNAPASPSGRVLGVDHLRKVVEWARERGTVVVSDECYLALGWEAEPLSILHPDVCGGSHEGLLAVHSLAQSANLASYRARSVCGDAELVRELTAPAR